MQAPAGRVVALGASNLTRGFRLVVARAERHFSGPVEVVAALGHGRSYASRAAFLGRRLPGILECGVWRRLGEAPRLPTRALVTDVGNDILYGAPPDAILGWVRECVQRLKAHGAEVVLTDLPMASLSRLESPRFVVFRSILVPSCRLSLAEAQSRAFDVQEGLVRLAAEESVDLVRLRSEWYGIDPIHIRPRHWAAAWDEIFGGGSRLPGAPSPRSGPRFVDWLRLYVARPETWWLLGSERHGRQPAVTLPGGTSVFLF